MAWPGYRYSPPQYPPGIPLPAPPRVHPSPTDPGWLTALVGCSGTVPRLNIAVGLISVGQLSLSGHFSGLTGITEVYNLVRIDRSSNHFLISGNE